MSLNNITRRFQTIEDHRSFARVFRRPTWIQVRFGEPPLQRTRSDGQAFKPRQRRALPRGCGRHGRRYNKTPRQSETATIHAGTSQTFPSFQMIIGKPRCRSSARFFFVARRCACDAALAHFGIFFSGIGFNPLGDVFICSRRTVVNR